MHDFMLAKEIIDQLKLIAVEKGLSSMKKVQIEIGQISMSHDGHPEHTEDISLENLQFGLKSIAKEALFTHTIFEVKKVAGEDWKITDIEV